MVKLTVVPVIPLALSEPKKTATLAISSSVMSRRGTLVRLTCRGKGLIDKAVETHAANEEDLLAAPCRPSAARSTLLRELLIQLERGDGA